MNDYFNSNTFPKYIDLVNKQEKVPGQDFDAVVFNNIFSEEEWRHLKNQFDFCPDENIDVQGYAGLGTLPVKLMNEEILIAKIEKMASDAVGEELEVLEYGGTRYSPRFGWYPKLGPHYDARPVEIFVFDYHVHSDEDWGVFIDGKRFNFYNNDALLFSGTGRVHWREQMLLKENSNVDLIFFWLQHKNPKPISKQHVEIMRSRASLIIENIDPMPGLEIKQWWEPVQISDNTKIFPDFKKISTDDFNPLDHNTVYRNVVDLEMINDFYKDYYVGDSLSKKVINFMTHIHAESKIKFLDSFFMRYDASSDSSISRIDDHKNIISLAINLKSSTDCNIYVNENCFSLGHLGGLSLSPTNQKSFIDTNSFKENDFVDMLFFNFILEPSNE